MGGTKLPQVKTALRINTEECQGASDLFAESGRRPKSNYDKLQRITYRNYNYYPLMGNKSRFVKPPPKNFLPKVSKYSHTTKKPWESDAPARGYTPHHRNKEEFYGRTFGAIYKHSKRGNFDAPEWAAISHRTPLDERTAADYNNKDRRFIQGYTGFCRGMENVHGRTYGHATNKSLTRSLREVVATSPIPSDPQCNLKAYKYLPGSKAGPFKPFRPTMGYTGHLPKSIDVYSKGFTPTVDISRDRQRPSSHHERRRIVGTIGNREWPAQRTRLW